MVRQITFFCFNFFYLLQSTRFMHERSTSNIHRLVHSSILFFEKFSDSLKLGFYIRNTILVIRNFFGNIVITIQTFRTELKSEFFSSVFRYVTRDIFIVFKPGTKNGENIKPTKITRKEKIDNSNP